LDALEAYVPRLRQAAEKIAADAQNWRFPEHA